MSKLDKVFLVGAIVVGVVAIVLLIVALATHEEEGLLRACWVQDRAVYLSEVEGNSVGTCADPTVIQWRRVPLKVGLQPYAGDHLSTDADSAVESAVDTVVTQLGPVLVYDRATDPSEWDVVITWGVPYVSTDAEPTPPGWCEHHRENGKMVAKINIRDVGNNRLAYRILIHELGHAIGLAHDNFEDSVMYPVTRDDTWEEYMSLDRFTDHDRKLIRRLYAMD